MLGPVFQWNMGLQGVLSSPLKVPQFLQCQALHLLAMVYCQHITCLLVISLNENNDCIITYEYSNEMAE